METIRWPFVSTAFLESPHLRGLYFRTIDGLRGARPSSTEDERLVRAAIEGIWHTRAD
jgi:hypothetical protein